MKTHLILTFASLVALPFTGSTAEVRLHGAVTLGKSLDAKKDSIESTTGAKLEIVGNGTGRGLTDLLGGSADVALLAGSLKGTAAAMNKEKPGSVAVEGLTEIPVLSVPLCVITHPAAGVKSLKEAQLRDVLSGKVTNWKDVGGSDQAIKLVLPFAGDGARITMQEALLAGADFAKDAVVRNTSKELSAVVAQLPGSISFLTAKNIEGNVEKVTVDKEFPMPLQFVVKGEPAGDVKKVIETAKTLLAQK